MTLLARGNLSGDGDSNEIGEIIGVMIGRECHCERLFTARRQDSIERCDVEYGASGEILRP